MKSTFDREMEDEEFKANFEKAVCRTPKKCNLHDCKYKVYIGELWYCSQEAKISQKTSQ